MQRKDVGKIPNIVKFIIVSRKFVRWMYPKALYNLKTIRENSEEKKDVMFKLNLKLMWCDIEFAVMT